MTSRKSTGGRTLIPSPISSSPVARCAFIFSATSTFSNWRGQLWSRRRNSATPAYLFTKPQSMDAFLAAYTRVLKDDIRRNRANIGEKLGFLGRIIHGSNPRCWAKELRARIGEAVDFSAAVG